MLIAGLVVDVVRWVVALAIAALFVVGSVLTATNALPPAQDRPHAEHEDRHGQGRHMGYERMHGECHEMMYECSEHMAQMMGHAEAGAHC